jgi:NAD(P)-dependent dehydrogenase (short-subunit alcohol dehydrogenase family)
MAEGTLQDKVAIVTGGTRGIGEAVVRRFATEGADVVVVARGDAAPSLFKETERVRLIRGDVADSDTARRAVSEAVEAFGPPDILVNNAAIDLSGIPLIDTAHDDIQRVFGVNAIGAIFMLQEAARSMRSHSGGSIVNVLSRAGLVGIPGMATYGATKGALASFTRTAAIELAPDHIRVNAVAPGATETPMMRTWIEEHPDPVAFEHGIVEGLFEERLATADEVASAILFLAGPASGYVTGVCLPVDGGYTAR